MSTDILNYLSWDDQDGSPGPNPLFPKKNEMSYLRLIRVRQDATSNQHDITRMGSL